MSFQIQSTPLIAEGRSDLNQDTSTTYLLFERTDCGLEVRLEGVTVLAKVMQELEQLAHRSQAYLRCEDLRESSHAYQVLVECLPTAV
jgi:hypothetical protein